MSPDNSALKSIQSRWPTYFFWLTEANFLIFHIRIYNLKFWGPGEKMNLQPFLADELLELRPLRQEDYTELFRAASDPLIWEMHPQPNRYKPEVFKAFFAEAMASLGALSIIDIKTKELIGSSRYYEYSQENSSVAIGYTFLARKYWGGTYNRELKKIMVNHALKFVKTAYFHVGINNIRSQKAMLKIGGINTGIQEIPVSYAPPKKSYVYKIEEPL